MPKRVPHIRAIIIGEVRKLVGGTGDDTVERNRKDVGLFGPDSACWKVHGDFTSMMVGGTSALLLQMLHPGALAGVWDHSDLHHDLSGRLKRTAQFIAGTTYGDVEEAQALIDHVRVIHARVTGTLPDGSPYSADDEDLLTWVHVAEVSSFMEAYLRYADPAFPLSEQDRYYSEVAEIARRLGAHNVPSNCAEVSTYLQEMRPKLRYDERTSIVCQALLSEPPPSRIAGLPMALIFDAAKDLLPYWAARMHGFSMSVPRQLAARVGVKTLSKSMRWALANSAEARARRRATELLSMEPGS